MVYILYGDKQRVKLDVFFLDTPNTLTDRIAWALKTLPQYLYISNPDILQQSVVDLNDAKEDIQVFDIWKLIRDEASADIIAIIGQNKNRFKPSDMLFLWAMYHMKEFRTGFHISVVFQEKYGNADDIMNKIYNTSPTEFVAALEKQRREFSIKQHELIQLFKHFNSIESYPVTELYNEVVTNKVQFTVDGSASKSLYSLFNNVNTTTEIPLITYSNYYKILHGYIPPLNWASPMDFILFKVRYDENRYNDMKIYIEGKYYIIELETNSHYDADSIIDSIISSIPNSTVTNRYTSNVGGYFAIGDIIDNNIFADILFTTEHIDEFISVNDDIRHTGDFGSRYLYFSNTYSTESTVFVKAMMTRKVATMQDIFPVNTVYTSFLIRSASNDDVINVFRLFISKLIRIYQLQYNTIKNLYEFLGVTEKEVKQRGRKRQKQKTAVRKKLFLKDIVPSVFGVEGENYARKCQPKVALPTIIDEDEVKLYEEQGRQVMKFPSDAYKDITEQRYYVCTDDTFKYPGLINYNNTVGGVAPCCKREDQRNKPKYKKYFNAAAVDKQPVVRQNQPLYVKKTDKIIEYGGFGYFPVDRIVNNIGKLFESASVNTGSTDIILRRGVNHTPNSFLECVLTAVGADLPAENDARVAFVERARLDLIKQVRPEVVLQEMYDSSLDEIVSYINNVNIYLDPEKTLRLVERAFNCNILLFIKNAQYPNGELIVPRHAYGYCKFKRDNTKKSIFIYSHIGSEADNLTYPHCEIISHISKSMEAEWKKNPTTFDLSQASVWMSNHPMYSFCWAVYDKLSTYYYKNIIVNEIPLDIQTQLGILSQFVDDNGKTRLIQLSNGMIAETSPLPPFDVPLMNVNNEKRVATKEEIRAWMKQYNAQDVIEYSITNSDGTVDYPQYIEGWIGQLFSVRMYVKDTEQMFISDTPSVYSTFIKNSKIARYLSNWIMYLFSQYINTNNIQDINKTVIKTFTDTFTIVKPNFEYELVGDTFNMEDAKGIFSENKLVCTSDELRKRLIYQLRLLIERDRSKVSTFYENTNLESYYQSENDFTPHPNEYILYYTRNGPHYLTKLLLTHPEGYQLYDYPPEINEAYFFQHPEITKNAVVLTRNFPTMDEAISAGITWIEQGYVKGDEPIIIRESVPYFLYTLKSDGSAKLYQVGRGVRNNFTIVVASRGGGVNVFAPLMDFPM